MNSLPKTVTRQRQDCDLNPGPSVPESSTLTTWLPSQQKSLYFIFYPHDAMLAWVLAMALCV